MAKVLVLGGSGFLGRALIAQLAAQGDVIDAVVRSEAAADKVTSASATAISAQEVAAGRYVRVINLVVEYGRGGAKLSDLIRTNVLYSLELIEGVDAAAVLNISSALPEDYSDYASSKKMLERSLQRVAARRGFRCVNIHLHNMYGPGCDETNLVAALIGRMRRAEPIALSSCRNSRDFIYIDDVVSGLASLSSKLDQIPDVSAVDVGSGRSTRLRDLVGMIQAETGSNSPINYGARPDNPLEPPVLVADLAAISATGWRPKWSLEQGLHATAAFMADEALPAKLA